MTSTRAVFASLLAFVVSMAVIVGLRRAARRVGLMDHPGGRKMHGAPTPLLGGIGIVIGTFAGVMVLPMVWPAPQFRAFSVAVGIVAFAGILDDLHELSARVKLMFQFFACSLLTSWAGISIASLGAVLSSVTISSGAWAVPFTLIAGVGLMNAVNMTDGLDGLVGTAAAITLGCMAVIAHNSGPHGTIYAPFLVLSLFAIFGFLLFNLPYPGRPLRTFLGDTGSLTLGLIITWFATTLSQHPVNAAPPIVFVWLCGLFLLDFLCVMAQRIARRRSPLAPDRRHFHHLLQRAGFSARATWFLLSTLHASICAAGIWMWKSGVQESFLLSSACLLLFIALVGSLSAARWIPVLRRRKSLVLNNTREK